MLECKSYKPFESDTNNTHKFFNLIKLDFGMFSISKKLRMPFKKIKMIFWLSVILLSTFAENLVKGVFVYKAKVGETVILPCPSDDKLHRFQYWQLKSDEIIGPWNNNQKNKYRYEVWSGRLIIRSVSETEMGFYKCFSKQILGSELRSETVELLVRRDWEKSFEDDPTVNTYRAVIGILALLIVIMIGVLVFFVKRRRSFIFQDSREESPEGLIPSTNSKAVYKDTNISLTKASTSRKKSTEGVLENAVVDTDISTSFSFPN